MVVSNEYAWYPSKRLAFTSLSLSLWTSLSLSEPQSLSSSFSRPLSPLSLSLSPLSLSSSLTLSRPLSLSLWPFSLSSSLSISPLSLSSSLSSSLSRSLSLQCSVLLADARQCVHDDFRQYNERQFGVLVRKIGISNPQRLFGYQFLFNNEMMCMWDSHKTTFL